MKNYCNQFILAERHIKIGGDSAARFNKSLQNNPMQKFGNTCAILTQRERPSGIIVPERTTDTNLLADSDVLPTDGKRR